ncbi:MAG TPA: hypothetical protein VJX30_07665 [Terriglobales bacterium]|jgi:hypothetical protein|nr:hypothetical protein [Terriglobales bacterium]
MSLELVVTTLKLIADQLDRMWIDREAFRESLYKAGFSAEQVQQISDEAQADPERQKQSRQAYAQMRASLEEAVKFAAIEVLSNNPPPPGESN